MAEWCWWWWWCWWRKRWWVSWVVDEDEFAEVELVGEPFPLGLVQDAFVVVVSGSDMFSVSDYAVELHSSSRRPLSVCQHTLNLNSDNTCCAWSAFLFKASATC